MIRNGSTGEETVLEGENAEEMMRRLSDVHFKTIGDSSLDEWVWIHNPIPE